MEEVMTPHAKRARQTIATTPGWRARMEDALERRVSPRDELRMLSKVLAREKVVREKLEELNRLKEEELRQEELQKLQEALDKTPEMRDLTVETKGKTLSAVENPAVLMGDAENWEQQNATPSRILTQTPGSRISNTNFVIHSRSQSPELNQSVNRSINTSQFEIEIPRNDPYDRLSLVGATRLSEAFPEFDLTQHESDNDTEIRSKIPQIEFEEIKRKESVPFVIEVDDFEVPEVSQIPDDFGGFNTDEDPVLEFAEGEEGYEDIPMEIAASETEDIEEEEGVLNSIVNSEQITTDASAEFTTQDDHEVYSHLVDDAGEFDLDQSADLDRPQSNSTQDGILKSLNDPLSAPLPESPSKSALTITTRTPRPRPTIPARIIKDLAASMTDHKLQPAALGEIMEASEEFFQQVSVDLAAYARHSKRKTIDAVDVLQLMRRQRATSSSNNPFVLSRKYLPQELVDEILETTSKLSIG